LAEGETESIEQTKGRFNLVNSTPSADLSVAGLQSGKEVALPGRSRLRVANAQDLQIKA
jgi:hypothetical protein